MLLYLSQPGGTMKGMWVLRTLGKWPAPVSKPQRGERAEPSPRARSNGLFLSISRVGNKPSHKGAGAEDYMLI